ncbi:PAAR domain-containing protein [Pseudomonas aeruginosa]
MKRYHITLGARTTAGGTVTSAWEHASIEGRPMAREGDSVFCPACGSVGVIVCVGLRLWTSGWSSAALPWTAISAGAAAIRRRA